MTTPRPAAESPPYDSGAAVAWDVGFDDAQTFAKIGITAKNPYQSAGMQQAWQNGYNAYFIMEREDT